MEHEDSILPAGGEDAKKDSEVVRERNLTRLISFLGVGAACLSALISIYAAHVSIDQIKIAKQQNEDGDRQSLATLVSDMAEKARALEHAPLGQQSRLQQARFADAEEALALIKTLKGAVPSVDDYEIGSAFDSSQEYFVALHLLERAAHSRTSPHYRADALRAIAGILYRLGGPANDKRARAQIALAYHAYDGRPDLAKLMIEQNEAFTYLYDIEHEIPAYCSRARAQLSSVEHLIAANPAVDYVSVEAGLSHDRETIAECH